MKACLQEPMFCSREESTYYLIIQQDEKSTQNKVETSEQASDGDIVASVLSELQPATKDNTDDEEDDADYIGTSRPLLHILSHQKAFMQWNKFPTKVLQHYMPWSRLLYVNRSWPARNKHHWFHSSTRKQHSSLHPHLHFSALTS